MITIPTKEEHDVGKIKTAQEEALAKANELDREVDFFVAKVCEAIRRGKDQDKIVTGTGLSFEARRRVSKIFADHGWALTFGYSGGWIDCRWCWTR